MATNIEIKSASTDEDYKLVKDMTQYAFAASPGQNESNSHEYFQGDHQYILYEDGKPMATAAAIPMTQQVRGKVFDMAGIAGVFTYPEARRRGHVKALMKHMFAKMKEKNQPITSLYPFKQSFYGKFGYITLPQTLIVEIKSHQLAALIDKDLDVSYRRYLLKDEVESVIQYYKDFQEEIHGMALFIDRIQQSLKERDRWVLEVRDSDDHLIALLLYRIEGFEKPAVIFPFLYKNSLGKYGALRYFALHAEQISSIKTQVYTGDMIETWLYDAIPRKKSRDWVPSPMARVFDISALRGIEVGPGKIHLQVSDPYNPANNSCWKLEEQEGLLEISTCHQGDGTPITIQAFSAMIFGGYDFEDFTIHGWGDLNTEEIAILTSMFPPLRAKIFQTF